MLAVVVAAAVFAAVVGLCSRSPVVEVTGDQDLDADRRLVSFHTRAGFIERYQARLKGQWMEVQEPFGGQACVIPPGTDACRLFVVESQLSLSDRMYLALDKCGVAARAPTLCDWIIRYVPDKWPRGRHITVEIAVPRRVHNQSIEPTGGSRFCPSAFVRHWRLPPAAHARRYAA